MSHLIKTAIKTSGFLSLVYFIEFSQNLKNGMLCEFRTCAKQTLLRRPWSLPSDREIPDSRQNLETKVIRAHIAGHEPCSRPTAAGLPAAALCRLLLPANQR